MRGLSRAHQVKTRTDLSGGDTTHTNVLRVRARARRDLAQIGAEAHYGVCELKLKASAPPVGGR